MGSIGALLAKWEIKTKGKRAKSPLLDKLLFGSYNKPFRPNRTEFDWLSRDSKEVDKYIRDPLCGGIFTAGFFYDLITGVKKINKFYNIKNVPQDLPIYLFSGEKDPVGGNTRGLLQVYKAYRKAGIKDITYKFYKGCRHEMLNEINRKEVYNDIISWLDKHC